MITFQCFRYFVMSASNSCCLFPNSSVVTYDKVLPTNCSPLLSDVDLFHILPNDTDLLLYWYGLCFGPMEPPAITWQELLPPLLVYGWVFCILPKLCFSNALFHFQSHFYPWCYGQCSHNSYRHEKEIFQVSDKYVPRQSGFDRFTLNPDMSSC